MDFQFQTGNASLLSKSEIHINQEFFIGKKKIEMHMWHIGFECCFEIFALIFSSFAGYLIHFN